MNRPALGWGILGTGRIARTFARGLARSRTSGLRAIGSRDRISAERFAADHPGIRPHGSYESLLADPEVAAVYIATPHPWHVGWCVRAAAAGKHILCEKPLGLNYAEAMVAVEAARTHEVALMEGFMYRCHPQTAKIVELVRSSIIGDVKHIQATFSYQTLFDPLSRVYSNAFAGGGILDVGCYPVSFARLVAGATCGRAFLDPDELKGVACLNPVTGTDDGAAAVLRFPGGLIAQVACGVAANQDNCARIFGTKGRLHVPAPWLPSLEGGASEIHLLRDGESQPEKIIVETTDWLYSIEADAFADALATGSREVPAMSVADTLGNMAALDAWRQSVGLIFEAEKNTACGRGNRWPKAPLVKSSAQTTGL